jgi:hypothetical protein
MRGYPKLGQYHVPHKTSTRKCAACGTTPAGRQDVQINPYRADDVLVASCGGNACAQAILGGAGWVKRQEAT